MAGQLSSGSEPPTVQLFERRSPFEDEYDIVRSFSLGGTNFQQRLNENNVYDLLLPEEVSACQCWSGAWDLSAHVGPEQLCGVLYGS